MNYRSILKLSIIAHGIGLQVSLGNLREVLTNFIQVGLGMNPHGFIPRPTQCLLRSIEI